MDSALLQRLDPAPAYVGQLFIKCQPAFQSSFVQEQPKLKLRLKADFQLDSLFSVPRYLKKKISHRSALYHRQITKESQKSTFQRENIQKISLIFLNFTKMAISSHYPYLGKAKRIYALAQWREKNHSNKTLLLLLPVVYLKMRKQKTHLLVKQTISLNPSSFFVFFLYNVSSSPGLSSAVRVSQ